MLTPAAFGETIQVFDKTGKVVSSSKHLLNVFKEAKSAYQERKAEIKGARVVRPDERHSRHARVYTIEDGMSSASSRHRHSPQSHSGHHHTPGPQRRHSGESRGSDVSSIYPASNARFEHHIHSPSSKTHRPPASPRHYESSRSVNSPKSIHNEMVRRHSNRDEYEPEQNIRRRPSRSLSEGAIDMNLAYGELPPDLSVGRAAKEVELKGLVGRANGLLVEADCLRHSVVTTIAHLQKNPEAMAAVALTLAEISNIMAKMGPSAIASLRSASPAVFALLASPQFLIAAGVAVGVTIVSFGGYKIIKKIKEKKAAEEDADEGFDLKDDMSAIESWRRGIAEIEAQSTGTNMDGEFITPLEADMGRMNIKNDRERRDREYREEPRELKSTRGSERTLRRAHSTGSRTVHSSSSRTVHSSSSRGEKSKSSKNLRVEKEGDKKKPKENHPSPLRLMFHM